MLMCVIFEDIIVIPARPQKGIVTKIKFVHTRDSCGMCFLDRIRS